MKQIVIFAGESVWNEGSPQVHRGDMLPSDLVEACKSGDEIEDATVAAIVGCTKGGVVEAMATRLKIPFHAFAELTQEGEGPYTQVARQYHPDLFVTYDWDEYLREVPDTIPVISTYLGPYRLAHGKAGLELQQEVLRNLTSPSSQGMVSMVLQVPASTRDGNSNYAEFYKKPVHLNLADREDPLAAHDKAARALMADHIPMIAKLLNQEIRLDLTTTPPALMLPPGWGYLKSK